MDLRKREKNFSAQPQTSGARYGDFEKRFFLDNHPRIMRYTHVPEIGNSREFLLQPESGKTPDRSYVRMRVELLEF
jgi:hypothetical protein